MSETITSVPMSDVDQATRSLIDQVRGREGAVVFTEGGQSTVLLVDAAHYDRQQRKLALLESLAKGEEDIRAGRLHSQAEVEALVQGWFSGDADAPG